MGLIETLEDEKRAAGIKVEGGSAEQLFGPNVVTDAGIDVSDRQARQYSAYFNAVYLISSYLGMISLKVFERRDDGGKQEVRQHPLFDTLHRQPNPEMSAASLREALQGHILNRGNAFAQIGRNGRGQVNQLWPLSPTDTKLRRTDDGTPFYVTLIGGTPRRLAFERVLHIPGMGFDGRHGWSILELARQSVGLGLASEKYGSKFFGNSAKPSGILVAPEELNDDQKRRIKESWEMAQGGLDNAQRTAVLEGGMDWQQVGISNEDAQFLELRQHQVEEIARWFNIPPHKIKDLRRATFDNISQEQISFLQDTIQPWLNRWEQAINTQLLTETERRRGLFAEFNVDTVLRSDPEQRAEMMRARFQTGSLTPNDIRALENENPLDVDGADVPYVQSNQIPLSMAGQLSPAQRALIEAASEGDGEAAGKIAEAYREELRRSGGEVPGLEAGEPEVGGGSEEDRQNEAGAVQERQRLRNAFRPLIEDAAGRLVRAETQDIQSELGRLFEEGGAAAFIEFLDEFYSRPGGEIEGLVERTMAPTLQSYVRAVAEAVAEDLDIEVTDDLVDGLMRAEDRGLLTKFIDKHAAKSRQQLQSLAEETPDDPDAEPRQIVEERLRQWREGEENVTPPRNEKIGLVETVAFGEATTRRVGEAGGVTAWRWDLGGTSACPICQQLEGTIIGAEENFVEGGENLITDEVDFQPFTGVGHPPAHQGGDCLLVPVGGG